MNLIKYIILSIISGTLNPLPLSLNSHFSFYNNLFNTKIFENPNNFLIINNIALTLTLLIIFFNPLKKIFINSLKFFLTKDKEKKKKYHISFKYLLLLTLSSIPLSIITIITNNKSFSLPNKLNAITLIINFILILIINKKEGTIKEKDLSLKLVLPISLFSLLSLIPGTSYITLILTICTLLKFNKQLTLEFTFMSLIFTNIHKILISLNTLTLTDILIPATLALCISSLITYLTYKWFIKIYNQKKLWFIALYSFITAIFILIWFR